MNEQETMNKPENKTEVRDASELMRFVRYTFRGKRLVNGKWVYGYLVEIQDNLFAIKDTVYHVNDGKINLIPDKVISETVGQFTGQKDKNGKKIYEGDIVEHDYLGVGEVKWDEGYTGFYVYVDDSDEGSLMLKNPDNPEESEYKVIGNIFENPELLG